MRWCATIEATFDFSFWDIPSGWWQASTVTMGIGVAIAVIGALTLLAAASTFLPHILKTPRHTRVLGSLQLLAGKYDLIYLVPSKHRTEDEFTATEGFLPFCLTPVTKYHRAGRNEKEKRREAKSNNRRSRDIYVLCLSGKKRTRGNALVMDLVIICRYTVYIYIYIWFYNRRLDNIRDTFKRRILEISSA